MFKINIDSIGFDRNGKSMAKKRRGNMMSKYLLGVATVILTTQSLLGMETGSGEDKDQVSNPTIFTTSTKTELKSLETEISKGKKEQSSEYQAELELTLMQSQYIHQKEMLELQNAHAIAMAKQQNDHAATMAKQQNDTTIAIATAENEWYRTILENVVNPLLNGAVNLGVQVGTEYITTKYIKKTSKTPKISKDEKKQIGS